MLLGVLSRTVQVLVQLTQRPRRRLHIAHHRFDVRVTRLIAHEDRRRASVREIANIRVP
jgi:hypothetical protein